MTTFKRIFLFYFINLAILLLINKFFSGELLHILSNPRVHVLALAFTMIAQSAGFLANKIIEKDKEKDKVYLNSAIIISCILATIVFLTLFPEWKHERKFGKMQANLEHIQNYGDYKDEIKIAFDTLVRNLHSGNNFKITSSFIDPVIKETIGNKDTSFLITFYYTKNDFDVQVKADLKVVNNVAYLISFDKPLIESDRRNIDSLLTKGKRDILKTTKAIPESLKSKELKEMEEELDK